MSRTTEPKKVEAIKALWESDMTLKEIAKAVGMSVSSIHRILVRTGAKEPEKQHGKRLSTEQKVQILKLYRDGVPVNEIMATVGCSKPTIYRYVHGARVLRKEITEDAVQEAIDLYMQGELTVQEICEKIGISKPTFYRKLRKHLKNQGS